LPPGKGNLLIPAEKDLFHLRKILIPNKLKMRDRSLFPTSFQT